MAICGRSESSSGQRVVCRRLQRSPAVSRRKPRADRDRRRTTLTDPGSSGSSGNAHPHDEPRGPGALAITDPDRGVGIDRPTDRAIEAASGWTMVAPRHRGDVAGGFGRL